MSEDICLHRAPGTCCPEPACDSLGEWLMVADREAILKERKIIEGRLKRNQDRLDELDREGA